jgi:proline iminopeptidase
VSTHTGGQPLPPPGDASAATSARTSYFDTSTWEARDVLAGGSRLIPVSTPSGTFRVWTKRTGTNPDLKVLLLHGGPGASSEGWEGLDTHFPGAGVEYYHYDQLGSYRSDRPDDDSLWEVDRFVDEVEQVRLALGLDRDNFVLMGQSWGGILAIEYALAHQQHLKGLVISNMMSSAPAYAAYARDVLMPTMDPAVLAEILRYEEEERTDDPRYMQLLLEHHYVHHVCRMPFEDWPEPMLRMFDHLNQAVYVRMQGPSELGIRGKLATWDRSQDLHHITVPTLVVGATHDTMDPAHLAWMADQLPQGRFLLCPEGSHCAQYDDPQHYYPGVLDFLSSL